MKVPAQLPPMVEPTKSASPLKAGHPRGARAKELDEDHDTMMRDAIERRAMRPVLAKASVNTGYGDLIGASKSAMPERLGLSAPLAPELESRFSKAYGGDLSHVRVHPDSPAPAALGARAITVGKDVAFAPGAYQPATAEGQRLVGHELAHVVQQSKGATSVQGKSISGDVYEREADEAADAALAGKPIPELSPVSADAVQLQAADAPAPAPAPAAPVATGATAPETTDGSAGAATASSAGAIGTLTPKTNVKVRKTAGGDPIGTLNSGVQIAVLAREGEWHRVHLPSPPPGADGDIGYVTAKAQYVTFVAAPSVQTGPTAGASGPATSASPAGGTSEGLVDAAVGLAKSVIAGIGSLWNMVEEGVDHVVEAAKNALASAMSRGSPGRKSGGSGELGQGGGTPASYAIADAKAYKRTAPPELKATQDIIPQGTLVDILEEQTVHSKVYVKLQEHGTTTVLGWTAKTNLGSAKEYDASLKPTDSVDVSHLSGLQRSMGQIYNEKGSYLKAEADALGVDVETVAAVLKVESGGKGFASDGRMIIRFENHTFYNQWGKDHPETFAQHFKFDQIDRIMGSDAAKLGDPPTLQPSGETIAEGTLVEILERKNIEGKAYVKLQLHGSTTVLGWTAKTNVGHEAWTKHQWRKEATGTWVECHKSQDQEWEVLTFARSLADEPAIKSASYGAGQVMGFNYNKLGFTNPTEMFTKFNSGMKPQLDGIISFCRSNTLCLEGMKSKDYVKFAEGYNGKGKAAEYGTDIKAAAEAYAAVTKGKQSGSK